MVETDAWGVVTREALFGPGVDRLEYLKVGTTTVTHRFPLEDARGSILNVVDEQGSNTTTFSYTAFGETTRTSGEPFPYAFTGRRYFESLKLYDFRNRFYDPWLGRFLQRDPIGIWGDGVGLGNGYAYVGNNPISRIDPFGLDGEGGVQGWSTGNPTPIDLGQAPVEWGPQTMDSPPSIPSPPSEVLDFGKKRTHEGLTAVGSRKTGEDQGADEEDCETSPKTFAEAKLQCHLTPTQYLDYIERKRFLESIGARQATIADFLALGARALQFVGGAAQALAGGGMIVAGAGFGWTGVGVAGVALGAVTAARGVDNMTGAAFREGNTVVRDAAAAVVGEGGARWVELGVDVGFGGAGSAWSRAARAAFERTQAAEDAAEEAWRLFTQPKNVNQRPGRVATPEEPVLPADPAPGYDGWLPEDLQWHDS